MVEEDIRGKLVLPSGTSRRLSDIDDMTRIKATSECSGAQFTMRTIDKFTRRKSLKTMLNSSMELLSSLDPSCFERECKLVSKILVLYTGGTIGMRAEKGVYKPQPNYFVKSIRRLPMFHDPTTDSLPVFASVPKAEIPLVMPLSPYQHRVVYVVNEYDPLIDSSDMTMDDWLTIGRDIEAEYQDYDGFVILSGTDTLSYTSSALSFILENLGKPVVVTGSQIPIFETRSDGRDNFLGALIVAGHCNIPEVTVYFHNQLFRGCRVTKQSTYHFDAFESPNCPPLVEFGVGMTVHRERIFRPYSTIPFSLFPILSPNVSILRFFPSIPLENVRHLIAEPIQGVVLQSFGAGNVPSSRIDLVDLLAAASARGCLLLNISQCPLGPVKPIYEGGARLRDIGVVCGGDMTPEAALTKLSYVLSKTEWSHQEKRDALERSLRGEVTAERRMEEMLVAEKEEEILNSLQKSLQLTSMREARDLRDSLMPFLMCNAAKHNNVNDLKSLTTMCSSMGSAWTQVSDYDLRTPLHVAANEGNLESVKYLLKMGALVHCRDRFGTTPLMNAIQSRHGAVISQIRKTGGHLHLSSTELGAELYRAAIGNDMELIRLFHLAGAKLSSVDVEGRNILHGAAFFNHEDVYHLTNELLEVDDIEELARMKDGLGKTPYDIAVSRGHTDIAELLRR